ncbi:carboxypeptidase-like regulatory domain-containing protein [Mucilaginibacter sp. AK015]|uniref:carboxypeptidase-like regulatory domain-containing protein n=1 Tax=Mucilaginibacter sp. AK015 TaxID=2723072 RepID=UPI00160BAB21|nr:carboxypeptidase-like regulatory domain-containing protein [Mucilaginibacter sp. AK015]MBB5397707.1 TonB-dependent SusC/RagA subfamily outer membrane receptor [Mucilaginibacter sp. AK015]
MTSLLKTLLFSLLLIYTSGRLFAQQKLTKSRQSSYYTYIYKLNPADVVRFYQSKQMKNEAELFHTLVDSFKTDKHWKNNLPAGNYLEMYADKNALVYKLIENHSAYVKMFQNRFENRFTLADKQGNYIKNATVLLNGKPVAYDGNSDTWFFHPKKDTSLLQVDHAGVSNFFSVIKTKEYHKGFFAKLWSGIKNIFKKKPDQYYKPSPYTGFMVFNKPKYKPNDTVRFKAFVLNAKTKKPVKQKKLLVKMAESGDDEAKTIGTVGSYRDGGFEYSFVLADSLDMSLDEDYMVSLVDETAETKAKSDEEKTDNTNALITGTFKYEEYELKGIKFDARLDKKEHQPGNPLSVYLKATDQNDLPIGDGRVTLTLTPNYVSYYYNVKTFVPDTLWVHKLPLDPVGETKITIPDSIFPKADISYNIHAAFLNADNESQEVDKNAEFNYVRFKVISKLSADTLLIAYSEFGKDAKTPALVSTLNADGDTLSKVKLMLPGFVKLNASADSYNIETDSTDTDIELKDLTADVSISGECTADSLFVSVANPRRLKLFYSIFAGGKLLDAGQGESINYKKAYHDNKLINVVVNYVWGGRVNQQQSSLAYNKDALNIAVKQPVSVYPGQKTTTDIVVTDAAGKPVANTDVTAWAVTRKFNNYSVPNVPNLGNDYPAVNRRTQTVNLSEREINGGLPLNWALRSRSMGLDSIEYYKFTHPLTTYRIEEPGADTITQIAPFVVQKGDVLPIHILYIDERPVYFSQAQQLQPYSFKVSPGKHSVRFRTSNLSLRVDSVLVEPSKKLILSINADAFTPTKMPDTMLTYEADLLNRYMVTVVNNFREKKAMLLQDDRIFFLNPNGQARGSVLAGPLASNFTIYEHHNQKQAFIAEPGYSYWFEPGLIKQTSIRSRYPFSTALWAATGATNYTQYVLTNARADSLWQNYLADRSNKRWLFQNEPITGNLYGNLTIDVLSAKNLAPAFVKNVIIYKPDDPDFIQIFPGNTTSFGKLATGKYKIFYLLKDDSYDIKEDITVKPNGTNYYRLAILPKYCKDSVSIKINTIISYRDNAANNYKDNEIQNDALKLKEAFNEKYLNPSFDKWMTGEVTSSNDKLPLPGVWVKVKGTATGIQTDKNGKFKINVPPHGKLIFSFIGFYTKEETIKPGSDIRVSLSESSNELQEVVVVGYSAQYKRELSYAVTTLNGMVAGVQVNSAPGAAMRIVLRGNNSFVGNDKALIVVDGIIVPSMDMLKPEDIANISVLKNAAGTALYGAAAANGVIIITTKQSSASKPNQPAGDSPGGEQTMRKNFSDYAYWQPKLVTDENGKASFTTVFPDDITSWRTFVVGINGNRQSGTTENQIKAFKPLSANFIAPQFAIAGDEMSLIGKVMNYNSTAATVNRSFIYNDKTLKNDILNVTNAKIDTLNIIAAAADSLTFEYSIKRDNGYFDGERRTVPVFKQGIKETKGVFEALYRDTTVALAFDPKLGPVTFRAEASALPALEEEATKLREYKYLCNEQLASKLKGLLAEKRIKIKLNEPFKYEKNILDIIKKLQDNRKTSGTWGWWKDSNEELWISLHAVEALVDAKNMGYDILLNAQKLTDYLVYQLESYNGQDKLISLQILLKLKAKIDYPKYITVIAKAQSAAKWLSNYDRLKLLLLRQQTGAQVNIDSLLSKKHSTLFGNIYWGDNSYRFFDNSIQESILAYQLIRNEGKHPDILEKIRGYFLEQRRTGNWRNTYEAAMILETILPDVLGQGDKIVPSVLTLKGSDTKTISKFPHTDTLRDNRVTISKTGNLPVYITGYQQFWNSRPEKVNKDFTVNSWFEKKGIKLDKLKGGEVVQLKIEVTAKGDGDYVMIEVPIPAGCSYEDKEQQWTNNEVHREYFKEKVSIFCNKLKQGTYTFIINLMPRYNGKYTLNPAKAELMYFPVFYGREAMKKVVIGN